jgi:hypothetical protein
VHHCQLTPRYRCLMLNVIAVQSQFLPILRPTLEFTGIQSDNFALEEKKVLLQLQSLAKSAFALNTWKVSTHLDDGSTLSARDRTFSDCGVLEANSRGTAGSTVMGHIDYASTHHSMHCKPSSVPPAPSNGTATHSTTTYCATEAHRLPVSSFLPQPPNSRSGT